MRVQSIALKHHGDIAVLGVQIIDDFVINGNLATTDVLQSCEHAQQGGLAATRWPHQHDKFSVGDLKADAMNDLDLAKVFFDVVKRYGCHVFTCSMG